METTHQTVARSVFSQITTRIRNFGQAIYGFLCPILAATRDKPVIVVMVPLFFMFGATQLFIHGVRVTKGCVGATNLKNEPIIQQLFQVLEESNGTEFENGSTNGTVSLKETMPKVTWNGENETFMVQLSNETTFHLKLGYRPLPPDLFYDIQMSNKRKKLHYTIGNGNMLCRLQHILGYCIKNGFHKYNCKRNHSRGGLSIYESVQLFNFLSTYVYCV
jgi:hypothetical protein